ncbi:MAG: hypothetical protein ACI9RG_000349 [Sulfurimonas sp.]|jgi:hypothetical protein
MKKFIILILISLSLNVNTMKMDYIGELSMYGDGFEKIKTYTDETKQMNAFGS